MKKVLLASTALVMTAGMAAADVTLSGYAEIGVFLVDDGDNGLGIAGGDGIGDDLQFHNDFDVKFTLSGETDGGLTFGATIDLDEVSNGISNRTGPDSVFVSGDFGTITVGDTDGAFDRVLQEIAWGTAIADDHSSHAGWNGNSGLDGDNDGQVARYDYSIGEFAFAASLELDDGDGGSDNDTIFGVGAEYTADFGGTSVNFALGYQTGGGEDNDVIGGSIDASFAGGFAARLNYSQQEEGGVETDHFGIGVAYLSGPLVVEVNYGQFDVDGGDEIDGFGAALNYDIGGGAVVMVGYGNDDTTDRFSAGLGLSF